MDLRTPSLPAPAGLVTRLPSHDLAATHDFYVRGLGLEVVAEDAARLRLRVGGSLLEFVQHDGAVPEEALPVLTFECDDPAAWLHRLRTLGVEVDAPPARSGGEPRGFTAHDPDGRAVAFRAPGAAPS